MSITLNEKQIIVYSKLKQFCANNRNNKFLLLAPSGAGKTTTVIKTLSETDLNVCFCAFTNKATKVMKDIVNKYNIMSFSSAPTFQTIHSLLKLEPNTIDISNIKKRGKEIADKLYNELYRNIYKWDELKILLQDEGTIKGNKMKDMEMIDDLLTFKYNFRKLDYLRCYDIIVIDEVSTISRELYIYLESTVRWLQEICNHNIKIIFLGDYYQLPPINEKKSIVFKIAQKEKWPLYKLNKVMRAKTNQVGKVNSYFINFINNVIKKKKLILNKIQTPYKVIPYDPELYINYQYDFLQKYVNINDEDKIIITYSNSNCDKLNNSIQSMIDIKNGIKRNLDPPEYPKGFEKTPAMIWFLPNDRLIVVHPITVPDFTINKINTSKEGSYNEEDIYCILGSTGSESKKDPDKVKIYNGDVLMVRSCKNIKIQTIINRMHGPYPNIPKYFNGQLLSVYYASDTEIPIEEHCIKLLHVDTLEVEKARRILKRQLNYVDYVNIMDSFRQNITVLKRGYCITCYKSQGSEFKHVFVNLKSFWACLASDKKINDLRTLFSAFYTACTRSSENLYLFY